MKKLASEVFGYRMSTDVGTNTSIQDEQSTKLLHKLMMLGHVQQQQNIKMVTAEQLCSQPLKYSSHN